MSDLNLDGMAIAPGVIETIVSMAVHDVEGVAAVGGSSAGGLRLFGPKSSTQGIEVVADEDDALSITVRVDVYYGSVLPDVADEIREAVVDAVTSQVGLSVASVDVFVDGVQFVD